MTFRVALFCSFAVLLCACGTAAPRQSRVSIGGYESLILVTGGAELDAELPMIIGLHYSSARPESIIGDFDQIDFPARIILPRGTYPRREGYSWFPSDYGEMSAAEQASVTLRVKDEVSAFIAAATKQYPTIGKPAITGTSYGGDLSYLIAIHHPDQVSAAFPVAARFPVEWMPSTNSCQPHCPPVHVLHGDKDPIVPIDGGRRAAKKLAELGYRVELHEYEGVAHDFSAEMKADFTRMVRVELKSRESFFPPRRKVLLAPEDRRWFAAPTRSAFRTDPRATRPPSFH